MFYFTGTKNIPKKYDNVYLLQDIGGKPAAVVKDGGKEYIWYDGEVKGLGVNQIDKLVNGDGKLIMLGDVGGNLKMTVADKDFRSSDTVDLGEIVRGDVLTRIKYVDSRIILIKNNSRSTGSNTWNFKEFSLVEGECRLKKEKEENLEIPDDYSLYGIEYVGEQKKRVLILENEKNTQKKAIWMDGKILKDGLDDVGDIKMSSDGHLYVVIKERNLVWNVLDLTEDKLATASFGAEARLVEINGKIGFVVVEMLSGRYRIKFNDDNDQDIFLTKNIKISEKNGKTKIYGWDISNEADLTESGIGDITKTMRYFSKEYPMKAEKEEQKEQKSLEEMRKEDARLDHLARLIEIIGEVRFGKEKFREDLIDEIIKVLLSYSQDGDKGKLSKKQEQLFAQSINDNLRQSDEYARQMIQYIPAVPLGKEDIERLVLKLFPELAEKRQSDRGRFGFGGLFGRGEKADPLGYLKLKDGQELSDGDPLEKNPGEIMEFRENESGFVVGEVLVSYDEQRRVWKSADLPIVPAVTDPSRVITATITAIPPNETAIRLPLFLGAKIIQERVKATVNKTFGGTEEIGLEVVLEGSGKAMGLLPKGKKVEKIFYTQEVSEAPATLSDLSEKEFLNLKKKLLAHSGGKELFKPIAKLPPEFNGFMAKIKDLPFRDKVIEIQKFVRRIGYYDLDNKEVRTAKQGSSVEERLEIMEQRMAELKNRKTELPPEKVFAGVCADFNLLTAAIMRQAGIPAGILRGFAPDGKKVTTKEAHAIAFTVSPDELGNLQIIPVDGTPGGTNEAENAMIRSIQQPTLESQAEKRKEIIAKEIELAKKDLAEILRTAGAGDPEEIKLLTNGRLENVLNVILDHEVRVSHLQSVKVALEAARYSPAKIKPEIDGDPQAKALLLRHVAAAVADKRKEIGKEEPEKLAGTKLFNLIFDYRKRFGKDYNLSVGQSLDLLKDLFDTARSELSDSEYRAAITVITYLRGKNLAGGKK